MKFRFIFSLVFLFIMLVIPQEANADGIIIPFPPVCEPEPCPPDWLPMSQLEIRYHDVDVIIDNQIAVTHVDQVFYNPNDWTIEGTYVFPVPKGATITDFRLWIDDKPVEGEILTASEARLRYEEIVRAMKDPALLEYADQGAFQVHIFPIPPKGERRIELEYNQVIPSENGLIRYIYPLNTEKFSTQPLDDVRISMEISSSSPIRAAYSPSHAVEIIRDGKHGLNVSYEAMGVKPDVDFVFYYSVGENEAFHLLSYKDPGEAPPANGFFTLLLAPRPGAGADPIPKDVLLVLDRSGSMEGEKFNQAQEASGYILNHLNREDRFNLVTFSTGVETFRGEMQPASAVDEALTWINTLSAAGSTDINRALLEAVALSEEGRPTYLIFLTDGLPTEGVIDAVEILKNLESSAKETIRLFAFGVGYDVDTFLLDSLANTFHGSSTYVLPGELINEILSGFYARISMPVLTNLKLDFGGIDVFDLYPNPLPDLFDGDQILVVGRYREGGATDVILRGDINQKTQEFTFPDQVFSMEGSMTEDAANYSFVPRLWATRKIGYLLNQIRLTGPEQEIIDQIVKLSIRYGIVTPYTSYLVTEPMPLGIAEQERIAEEQLFNLEAVQDSPTYGQEAVEKAAGQGELANSNLAPESQSDQANDWRVVGSRTFILSDNGTWIDTGYDPATMETVKVSFLSDDYFSLAKSHPTLATAFALGAKVIAISDGVFYEVVGENILTDEIVFPEDKDQEAMEDRGFSETIVGEGFPPQESISTNPSFVPEGDPNPVNATIKSDSGSKLLCLGGFFSFLLLVVGVVTSAGHKRQERASKEK